MTTALVILLFVVPGTATALKHRWLLLAAGLLLGPAVWCISFVLPARKGSWWYVHVYRDEQRARVDRDLARSREHVEHARPAEALARIFRRR